MQKVAIFAGIVTCIYLLMATMTWIGWYKIYEHRPVFRELSPGAISSIEHNSDLTQVRAFALHLIKERHQMGAMANRLHDQLIDLIVKFCLINAFFAVWLAAYATKIFRKFRGKNLGWLQWL